ncbi:MAG: lipid A-modifier LpxR family protein [Pseudomonadota bacterium]|nr:lipid A-modifier LpxR family protein [Pseudomonadota bacterium]
MTTQPLRLLAVILMTLAAGTASAQDRSWSFLGWANLTTNDGTGDGQDRWQSFSTSTSFLFGPKGTQSAPYGFGDLVELRLGTQIMSPANTVTPAPGDRRAAGVVRAALFTHFARGGWDVALGAGAEAVGPATRVIALQDAFHRIGNFDRFAPGVISNQLGNRVRPMGHAEVAYAISVGDQATFRPFAAAHVGLETYARIGFDLLLGPGYQNGVIARDYVSGQPYQILKGVNQPGVSFLFGADVARVFSSSYLPQPTYALTPTRARIRGGLLVDGEVFSVFYGMTYLTPEFRAQPEGQVVGSVQVRLKF